MEKLLALILRLLIFPRQYPSVPSYQGIQTITIR
jgi:hypothetical protein